MPRPGLLALAVILPFAAAGFGGAARADAPMRTVSGALTYLPRIALPPEAEMVLAFRGRDGAVLAEERVPAEGRQVPLPFRLWVPAEVAGAFEGEVAVPGRSAWRAEPVAVAAGTAPVDLGEIVMAQTQGDAPGGAAAAPEPAAAAGDPLRFDCGGTPVTVVLDGDGARMTVADGAEVALAPVPAASGARYEAEGDPGTFFWSRGDRALVGLDGATLPECVAAEAAAGADPGARTEPAAAAEATVVRAQGNEPGWTVRIGGDRLVADLDYGARRIEAAAPAPEAADGATVWRLPEEELALSVEERLCRDSMTGMPYPRTARLTVGEAELDGCAGDPASLLAGPEWRVESVGGAPVGGTEVSLAFLPEGRVAGSGGCNRFTGGYTLGGEVMSLGPLASTQMACGDEAMAVEGRFYDALGRVTRFDIAEDGALELIAGEGPVIVARR